ncbi:MAG: hypothetical protein ABII74_05600 [Elusimicrobiota bacterium]
MANFTYATMIGSLPHLNPEEACRLVLACFPQFPVWPQLTRLSFKENMYVQYSQCVPGLVINEEKNIIYFKQGPEWEKDLEKFYERFLEDDLNYFAITPEYACGLHTLYEQIKQSPPKRLKMIKGQITGPITFGLAIKDEHGRSIFYNQQMVDLIVKNCMMKARWQIQKFRRLHQDFVLFLDEPYLSAYGSAFTALSRQEVINCLNEIIEAVHREKVPVGVHCCGNTDWSLLLDSEIDILSFDAYEFFDTLNLYPDQLRKFINSGKTLAWGLVPTGETVSQENVEKLSKNFFTKIESLAQKGISKEQLLRQVIITPACGVGTRSPELAEKVLKFTQQLAEEIDRTKNENL